MNALWSQSYPPAPCGTLRLAVLLLTTSRRSAFLLTACLLSLAAVAEETGESGGPDTAEARAAALEESGGEVARETEVFLPCKQAAEVVSETMVAPVPEALSSWPLYEIELEAAPEERRVNGRMQISLAAP
ncbi:MAG: hypothetical protein ACOCVR_04995, partial [Myxococcota bacterium]